REQVDTGLWQKDLDAGEPNYSFPGDGNPSAEQMRRRDRSGPGGMESGNAGGRKTSDSVDDARHGFRRVASSTARRWRAQTRVAKRRKLARSSGSSASHAQAASEPLRPLHALQAVTRFPSELSPPRMRGCTWSSDSCSAGN